MRNALLDIRCRKQMTCFYSKQNLKQQKPIPMKQNSIFSVAITILLLTLVWSCKKDSNNANGGVTGKWKPYQAGSDFNNNKVVDAGELFPLPDSLTGYFIVVESGGQGHLQYPDSTVPFTWALQDKSLTITQYGMPNTLYVQEIKGNTMTFRIDLSTPSSWFTMTRQ
jgi:hypothetical protein